MHSLAFEGVQLRAGDIEWLRGRMPMKHEILRQIQPGERAHIDHPGRRFDVVPHPEAQARAEEIVTAWVGCLRDICAIELAKRTPASDAERDAALVLRLRHDLLCEMKISDKALLAEIREVWAAE